jgi:hypothetical protein
LRVAVFRFTVLRRAVVFFFAPVERFRDVVVRLRVPVDLRAVVLRLRVAAALRPAVFRVAVLRLRVAAALRPAVFRFAPVVDRLRLAVDFRAAVLRLLPPADFRAAVLRLRVPVDFRAVVFRAVVFRAVVLRLRRPRLEDCTLVMLSSSGRSSANWGSGVIIGLSGWLSTSGAGGNCLSSKLDICPPGWILCLYEPAK